MNGPASAPPSSPDDVALLDALREAWTREDPVPGDLAERSLVAIAMDDLDLDLMLLQDSASQLVGARGVDTARTLTFSGDAVSVMVTITPSRRNHFRLDGWVAPLGGGRVQARHAEGHDVDGDVDREGRFVLHDVPAGLVQLVYHPRDVIRMEALDDDSPARRERRRVPRSVAAPPVRL